MNKRFSRLNQQRQQSQRRTSFRKSYTAEEIFVDIEGDEENVLMNIPPEIIEQMGWAEGDTLNIEQVEGSIVIKKVEGP
jgi:formylmethanofuran dehydrogenase subunit D